MLTTSIQTVIIYHCINCGAVQHQLPGQDAPICCKTPMVNAAARTVCEGDCEAILRTDRNAPAHVHSCCCVPKSQTR